MDIATFRSLREALDSESISLGELILIESVFDTIPDDKLRDLRENAMAGDMLDEIEDNGLLDIYCPDCGDDLSLQMNHVCSPEVENIGVRKVLDCE